MHQLESARQLTFANVCDLFERTALARDAVEIGKVSAIWAISDLHINHGDNSEWLEELPAHGQDDLIIVAGDVCETLALLKSTLIKLKSCFGHVMYCPGNHEMWMDRESREHLGGGFAPTSLGKFFAIMDLCDELGVHTLPVSVNSNPPLVIVPLFSWFNPRFVHTSFEYLQNAVTQMGGFEMATAWPDFLSVQNSGDWELRMVDAPPAWSSLIDMMFTEFNKVALDFAARISDVDVISFSHFVDHRLHFKHNVIDALSWLGRLAHLSFSRMAGGSSCR